MSKLKEDIGFDGLIFPGLEGKVTKHISYVPNLSLGEVFLNKTIKIDDNLSIINGSEKEQDAILFLKKYLKITKKRDRFPGVYFIYKYLDKPKWYFEAQSAALRFVTAIRIYKETRCDSEVEFPIEDSRKKKYYRPYDFTKDTHGIYMDKERSRIDSRKELIHIKKIYIKLGEANFSKTIYYSKLYNAVKFFNHSYDEHWILLKTTLAFTALESLFSDSSKSEVSFKIALRAAYFLYPKDSNKRKEVFNIVKRGYDIRSYFVHGSDTEKQINKIMKKFEKERGVDHYSFFHNFIFDLNGVVSKCLTKILTEEKYFNFFTKEKHLSDEEVSFFDDLVLDR